MKNIYDDLIDFILNTTLPATDSDINTLYRFVLGNKHQLTQAAKTAGDFPTFLKIYRTAEDAAAEFLQDEQ